jgi:hypothetical protein
MLVVWELVDPILRVGKLNLTRFGGNPGVIRDMKTARFHGIIHIWIEIEFVE